MSTSGAEIVGGLGGAAWRLLAVGCCAAWIVACGGDGATPDAGQDATPNVSADAGPDTVADTGRDGGAGLDAADVPEVTDAVDASDGTDPVDAAADADADGNDASDASDTVDASDAGDAPDGTNASDVPPPETFPMACQNDGDCEAACAHGVCVGGRCQFAAPQEGCIIVDEAAGTGACVEAGASSPAAPCLVCNPAVRAEGYTPILLEEGFEAAASGVQVQNLSGSSATWFASDQRAAEGTQSLHFAVPGAGTYDAGQRAWARATVGTLTLPAGLDVELRLWVWLETEQLSGHDVLRVLLVHGADAPVELWSSDEIGGTTDGEFVPLALDLGGAAGDWVGSPVQLAVEFDTVDDLINAYEGAYVDGVRVVTGCCAQADDCEDGNPCTMDACPEVGAACTHEPVEGCCVNDAGCDDGNDCTVDQCEGFGGSCLHEAIEGCCHVALDCDDGDACTEDTCDEEAQQCKHQPLCCAADADCDDGDKCTQGRCAEGQCLYDFVCCVSDAECDDGEYCTKDQCVDGDCVHPPANLPGCCVPGVLDEDFEGGTPDGWTFTPIVDGVGWQVTTMSKFHTGPSVLYYGNPGAENFDNGEINTGTATSPPLDIPSGVETKLDMWVYFDGESSLSYDDFWVEVDTGDKTFTVVKKSDIKDEAWKHVVKDLSYLGGKTIQLKFRFDTIDGTVNKGYGVVVDDLKVVSTCQPKTCTSAGQCSSKDSCVKGSCGEGVCTYDNVCCQDDLECDDGLACTADACQGGKCKFTKIQGCCETDEGCDDGNPCTIDACTGVGGTCLHQDIPGCCVTSADCDDGDICTGEACVDMQCTYSWLCCSTDAECDDGDDVCTIDQCVDMFCAHTQTGVPGCCDPQPVDWTFETPVTLTFEATSPPCQWQVTDAGLSESAPSALYYGDLGNMNYDCGHNAGTATSQPLSLAAGYPFELRFKVYLGTEQGKYYDGFWVEVVADGTPYTVWDKGAVSSAAYNQWTEQVVDLSAFAGHGVQLRFQFDTFDAFTNTGKGVFLDDITVTSPCEASACTADTDCDDGLALSTDACMSGACAYTL